jgi:HAMP domain-containing protein
MSLAAKFNLVFLVVFTLGLASAAYVSRGLLVRNAREETLQNARIVMETASASRGYTTSQIAPLLKAASQANFLPQTVPAYGATEELSMLHAKFPDYAYKEATLNPTNLRDRAVEWEADIVNRFRQYPQQTEAVGDRETPSGPSLYLAHPIRIEDPSCLECHSTVDVAPKSMLAKYGSANGFGWRLGDIVGAQIVSVPATIPLRRADTALHTFMAFLGTVLLVLLAALNVMLRRIVVSPVTRLAKAADDVSLGNMKAPDLPAQGRDEVARLAQSFNRMKKSLSHALKLLDE